MNRLDLVHTGARTELPECFSTTATVVQPTRAGLIAPIASFYLAIAGFLGCGAAVILTVSLLALHIQ